MRDTTKQLRAEMIADIYALSWRNNSKDNKRTAEQVMQSYDDRIRRMRAKWAAVIPETPAQVRYQSNVFDAMTRLEERRDAIVRWKGGEQ